MRHLRSILSTLAILLAGFAMQAADGDSIVRPVNVAYTAEYGAASLLDTYLTPIRYEGWHVRHGCERNQAMRFSPRKWLMQMSFGVRYDNVQNIVKNRTMHSLMVDFNWGMMHRWRDVASVKGLQLMGGGSTLFDGGATYNQYNSNNPVSVKIRWSVNLTGMAVYNMNIGKLPLTLRYQATIPVAGLFFSPEYGEAFYEIYLGNTRSLVNFGWWGNRFDMTNRLTADLHFGATSLRIGYRNTIENSWVHNLNTQISTHSLVIGVSGEWMSVNPRRDINHNAKIISALY